MHPRPTDINTKALLQRLTAKVCTLDKNTDGVEALLQALNNLLTSTIRTPGRAIYEGEGGSGTIAPGFRSFTVTNLGLTNALLDGFDLYPGQSNTFDAGGQADVLAGMSYDSQSAILEIITVL